MHFSLLFAKFQSTLALIYLIIRSLQIMLSTFHNLDRHISGVFKILREPNSRKMPPSKFLYDYISIKQYFSNMTCMIPQ